MSEYTSDAVYEVAGRTGLDPVTIITRLELGWTYCETMKGNYWEQP